MLFLAMNACECMAQEIQQASGTVQITDMLGRQLTVPENISSVISTSPPSTILVYMLAPDKLAGWNFINNFNHTLMDENYKKKKKKDPELRWNFCRNSDFRTGG